MGAIHPTVQDRFGLSAETYVLEVEIAPFVKSAEQIPQFEHVPQFPSVSRDIAVVVKAGVSASDLEAEIRKEGGALLVDVRIFDVYTGKQVKSGYKSVAFNLTFQDVTRTLQDKDVDDVIKQIVANVQDKFGGMLRD